MSAAKHTPGPWQVGQWDPLKVCDSSDELGCSTIASVVKTGHPKPRAQDIANARLIAAAPELLEAAKLVIAWYEAEDDHSKADFYQRIEMCRESEAACRAAIAKATGEPHV